MSSPDTAPPPKRRGRPPLDAQDPRSVNVHVRIPTRQYDAVCTRAAAERVTIPELMRRALRRA